MRRDTSFPSFHQARKLFLATLVGALVLQAPPSVAEEPAGVKSLDCTVFQARQLNLKRMQAQIPLIPLFRNRQYSEAEALLHDLATRFPNWADVNYNLAAAQSRQGRTEDALTSLATAVDKGFAKIALMVRDADFATLKGNDRYTLLLAATRANARQANKAKASAQVAGGSAFVTAGNTVYLERQNRFFTFFKFADKPETPLVRTGDDQVSRLLNGWAKAGTGAGNHGDIYDNRDRGHSTLNRKKWPQLSHIDYSACATKANVDYGLNSHIFFNAITFGNSSTALSSGPMWRSQPRLGLTTPKAILDTVFQATNNHLYVYPAVTDYGPKYGDMLPVNTIYMLLSKGASGSDRPILEAVATILAALNPQVKRALRAAHLISPTVQMIFRRGLAGIESREDYLSGKAHPTAFDGKKVDLVKMAFLAHGLKRDEVPPVVWIKVEEESRPRPNVELFASPNILETFLTTPGAIGRIMRGTGQSKRMLVSAKASKDPNGRPLTFIWSVLSGDEKTISIRPLEDDGSRAEIIIPWHDRREIRGEPGVTTDRVDIGVFADNGANISAPAFVSVVFPPNQHRTYKDGRIQRIDYNYKAYKKREIDPLLFPLRDWADEYHYAPDGTPQGWTRHRNNSKVRFLTDGRRVVKTDAEGRPLEVETVIYKTKSISRARKVIEEFGTGKTETLSP